MTVFDKDGAAAYLLVGIRTIERLMEKGEIAFSRVGKQIRFRQVKLDEYLEQKERKSTAELKASENKRPRR